MDEKEIMLTQEGYDRLVKELANLKGPKKMQIAERIKLAREYGDISENSEYDEAKNEQALLESRILETENILRLAKVAKEDSFSNDFINIGTKVKLYDYEFDEELIYQIVGVAEVDLMLNKISNESPVGRALIGKMPNEDIEITTPGGTNKYKVISIEKQ